MEYSICFLFYWGFFDILSTLGWLSLYIYIHTILLWIIYLCIYMYRGERKRYNRVFYHRWGSLYVCMYIYNVCTLCISTFFSLVQVIFVYLWPIPRLAMNWRCYVFSCPFLFAMIATWPTWPRRTDGKKTWYNIEDLFLKRKERKKARPKINNFIVSIALAQWMNMTEPVFSCRIEQPSMAGRLTSLFIQC
jgi:hypothetical protein